MNASDVQRVRGDENALITLDVFADGGQTPLVALLDSGASNNFVRREVLEHFDIDVTKLSSHGSRVSVILADGTKITAPKQSVTLSFVVRGITMKVTFIVLKLNTRFDLVLGMPWFKRFEPVIDWKRQSIVSFNGRDVVHRSFVQANASHSLSLQAASATKKPIDTLNVVESDGPTDMSCGIALCSDVLEQGRCFIEKSDKACAVIKEKSLAGLEKSPDVDRSNCRNEKNIPGTGKTANALPMTGLSTRSSERRQKIRRTREKERGSKEERDVSECTHDIETATNVIVVGQNGFKDHSVVLEAPPKTASEMMQLPAMNSEEFMSSLLEGDIEQICWIVSEEDKSAKGNAKRFNALFSVTETPSADMTKKERVASQGWESLETSPYYKLLREFEDIFPEEVPAELPQDKGIRHEIDLIPGTKYCVTRQWPLPPEQVKAIDDFFEARHKAGQVRESKSPHSSPTFCVKKATGGWRIVHAFNKLNDATVPAQTPIPRKDVIVDGMQGSTKFSTLDLRDGFYQILMRLKDIPLTAVSTPSGMLWEWLVMPQGLKNAPATFNRCVTHLLRPVRHFAPSYFDDVYIHSRAQGAKSDVEVHEEHLRALFTLMRKHKLYANLQKCLFGVDEIPVLGDLVGRME